MNFCGKAGFATPSIAPAKLVTRVVTDEDIRSVGRTAHTTRLQDGGSWKVTGRDECDLEMTVVCRALETRDLLLITVY